MKICFISTMAANRWGGSEELLASAVRYALEQGDEVLLSVPYHQNIHSAVRALEQKGASLRLRKECDPEGMAFKVAYKIKRALKGLPDQPQFYTDLLSEVKDFNPEFIFVNMGGVFNIVEHRELVWLLRTVKKPFYLLGQTNEEHRTYPYAYIERIRSVYAGANKVFFISHRNMEVTKRQLADGSLAGKYCVVQNPCRVALQEPLPYPGGNTMNFALVGVVECRRKGHDLLFNVFGEEKWQQRDWMLNIYGEGPDVKYLKDLAEYYRISSKVKFHGFAGDVLSVWKENHIAVLPSLNEGTSLALMEGLACGRAAIVTDVGDSASLAIEGKTGFVADAAAMRLIAEAVERAWQQRDKWKGMGVEAYHFAKKNFDPVPGKTLLEIIKKDVAPRQS